MNKLVRKKGKGIEARIGYPTIYRRNENLQDFYHWYYSLPPEDQYLFFNIGEDPKKINLTSTHECES